MPKHLNISPIKTLYSGFDDVLTKEEKFKLNQLAMLQFKKPVKLRTTSINLLKIVLKTEYLEYERLERIFKKNNTTPKTNDE